jgi:sugar phosphate isomerase/epimerase
MMRFAFSTISCPTWDFATVAARAKEYGYDGVEIRGFLNESILTSANVFLSDPAKVRRIFEDAGVGIACLASSIAMAHEKKRNAALAADLRMYIDTTSRLGCKVVKIFDTAVRPGQNRAQAAVALGNWLAAAGDYAAERDVLIVVENALSFRTAKELWLVLESINHPAVAACWDIFNAAQIGESPYVSVPVLNSRIQYVQVKDAKLGPLGASYCKLGEGDVPVKKLLIRLMGIGYTGWVTLEWEKAWLPNIAEPEEILPDSIKKLREWTKPQEEEGDATPKKQAHTPAPAPAAPAAAH